MVAEVGGAFELELAGGFLHLAFEFAQDFGGVVDHVVFGDEAGVDLAAFAGGFVVGMEAFLHFANHALGSDVVLGVVFFLLGAAVFGDVDEALNGVGDLVAKQNALAVEVAGGATGGLDEGGLVAEKAFFVGIENTDERNLGEVEAFAEKVDADENVELGGAEGAQDFDALDGVDVGVEVAHLEIDASEIVGEVFGGFFGESGDEDALVFFHPLAAEFDGFVDLAFEWFEVEDGIEKSGGSNDLFDHERGAAFGGVERFHGFVVAARFDLHLFESQESRGHGFRHRA